MRGGEPKEEVDGVRGGEPNEVRGFVSAACKYELVLCPSKAERGARSRCHVGTWQSEKFACNHSRIRVKISAALVLSRKGQGAKCEHKRNDGAHGVFGDKKVL